MMTITQISNTANSHTLEDLEEDSEFNISLIAINPAGRSEPATLMGTTLPSVPTGAPQDLNITSVDFTNVTIQWNPVECLQRNGRIDGYRLVYYPTVDSSNNESILINGSNTNTYAIIGLQPRVNYTLTLGAVSENYLLFRIESSNKTVLTLMPQAVGFLIHGKVYGNNSIVSLSEIGEGRDALLCITSEADCCRYTNNIPLSMREWYFPNGSSVKKGLDGHSFYRDRDPSIVRLNRRHNVTSPNGIFQCIIPSSIRENMIMTTTIHIGIYDIEQGIPEITSFHFSRSSTSLNCTSRGGPVTTVTWKINNQNIRIDGNQYRQTQIIVNSVNAEYKNILYSNDASNLVGVLTCIVQNTQGSDNKTISTDGVFVESIAETYTVGNNANITCRSDVATERIEWLRDERTVIVFGNNVTQLDLSFTPVNGSVHDQVYICRVIRSRTDVTEQNFTMKVDDPDIMVQITSTIEGHNLTAGTNFSLICTINGTAKLRPKLSFQWIYFNGTDVELETGTNSSRLHFSSLKLSEAGEYMCRVNIRSSLLKSDLNMISMLPYPVRVFAPLPNVSIIPPSQAIFAGSSPNVTCVAEFDDTVDVPLVVNIAVYADGDAINPDYPVHMESYTRYTKSFTIINIQASQEYVCSFLPPYSVVSPFSFLMTSTMDPPYLSITVSITASKAIEITSSGNNIVGEKYNLICTAVINGSSDVPSISWNSSSMSDEIISNGNGTYLSVLYFDPLLFSDQGTYTCEVKIADITDIRAYHLSANAPTVLVNIEDTGVAKTAGKSYTLICNVSHPKYLNPTFEYQWFKDNGTLTRVGTNSSTLSFHFLRLSDIGWYTCNVIIDYTHLSGPASHVSSRAFELQFSVPQPVTMEVISDIPNPILSGTLLTLTCAVELSSAVDVPVTISTVWTAPDGSALTYNNPPIRLLFTHYISIVVLKDIELADSGDYTCTVDIGDKITISARYSVIVGNGMFQLRLKRTEDCQLWTSMKATTYRNNIEDALEEAIKRRCRCSFSKDNLLKGSFGCDTSPNLTTYRNTLIGTHNFNATQLIGFIQDWVTCGPKIKMDWYTIGVDSSCSVAIASLEEKECD